ncbi:hypothetical protein HX071_14950 [Myroides marinus]|uniref:hypothetical protein n=1 Tax=Myroides marinus TaxID=703342 RepID=UPI0025765868|nr:hypothetical protein [Myroides marinus]MDM1347635.1 hypothetical protein [Myroides marinus]MDM1356071.1 hypothetical protein [Myroides marinus]MDM1363107.1 hypothetical protein [Myroides marinus]MDM1503485.1 hypothetical protein [Myroides marinus]
MENNSLKEQSTEALKKKLAVTKGLTILLTVVMIVLFAKAIYDSITKEFNVLIAMPLAFTAILAKNIKLIKDIKAELKSRPDTK